MLTEEYIMKLLERYANSRAGREELKRQGVDIPKGERITAPKAGEKHVTIEELTRYGEEMKSILFAHVNPLIKSISFDDIVVGRPKKDKEGNWSLTVSFRNGSLHRDSLYTGANGEYENGLANIVLLFAKGYHAKNYVYGVWKNSSSAKRIKSRKDRAGSDFLIRAVDEFNALHGADGTATAELLGKYKEDSENPS